MTSPISRIHLDWQAVTSTGQIIKTFNTAELAAEWVETSAHLWPGARVELVRTSVTRKVIYDSQEEAA
jgi:hypothetical protein